MRRLTCALSETHVSMLVPSPTQQRRKRKTSPTGDTAAPLKRSRSRTSKAAVAPPTPPQGTMDNAAAIHRRALKALPRILMLERVPVEQRLAADAELELEAMSVDVVAACRWLTRVVVRHLAASRIHRSDVRHAGRLFVTPAHVLTIFTTDEGCPSHIASDVRRGSPAIHARSRAVRTTFQEIERFNLDMQAELLAEWQRASAHREHGEAALTRWRREVRARMPSIGRSAEKKRMGAAADME